MLKVALCDSNLIQLKLLEQSVDRYLNDEEHLLFCFGDSSGILSYLEGVLGLVDIVFVNLTLADADGMNTVRIIADHYPAVKIITISDNTDRIEELFTYNPAFFLRNPVSESRLTRCLNHVVIAVKRTRYQFLSLSCKSGLINILFDSIQYIESDKRTITVYEEHEQHSFYEKLDDIEQRLDTRFLRCHKSFLVNMDRIKSFFADGILLLNGAVIPVSQNRYTEAKQAFVRYISYKMR